MTWEYKIAEYSTDLVDVRRNLQLLADEGWELVAASSTWKPGSTPSYGTMYYTHWLRRQAESPPAAS